jgi:hypothetical protein
METIRPSYGRPTSEESLVGQILHETEVVLVRQAILQPGWGIAPSATDECDWNPTAG